MRGSVLYLSLLLDKLIYFYNYNDVILKKYIYRSFPLFCVRFNISYIKVERLTNPKKFIYRFLLLRRFYFIVYGFNYFTSKY